MKITDLSVTLQILSAMVTPTVLILACGSLILATSQRLSRVLDRTRRISDRLQDLSHTSSGAVPNEHVASALINQLARAVRRARILQRALSSLYIALSVFVATIVTIGVIELATPGYTWLPVLLGFSGTVFLFYVSILLIAESRIAITAVNEEMDFAMFIARAHKPQDATDSRTGAGETVHTSRR